MQKKRAVRAGFAGAARFFMFVWRVAESYSSASAVRCLAASSWTFLLMLPGTAS